MKTTVLIFAFAILCPCLLWSSATGGASQKPKPKESITWKTTRFGFGTRPYGKDLTTNFEFVNSSDKPIIIADVRNSCGCTTNDWIKGPVLPGKSGIVSFRYDGNRTGNFTKCADVYLTNGEQYLITICGRVLAPDEMADPNDQGSECGCNKVITKKTDMEKADSNAKISSKVLVGKRDSQTSIPSAMTKKLRIDTVLAKTNALATDIKSNSLASKTVLESLSGKTVTDAVSSKTGFDAESFKLYPNPSVDVVYIHCRFLDDLPLEIDLYDISGKLVKNLVTETTLQKGDYTWNFNIADIKQGVYMVAVRSREGIVWSQRLVKM